MSPNCCRCSQFQISWIKSDVCNFTFKIIDENQVNFLGTIGIPAIAIEGDEDPEIIQQIQNGYYIIVYCAPECMLSSETWRALFDDATFREMLIRVAIDKAHCVTRWLV